MESFRFTAYNSREIIKMKEIIEEDIISQSDVTYSWLDYCIKIYPHIKIEQPKFSEWAEKQSHKILKALRLLDLVERCISNIQKNEFASDVCIDFCVLLSQNLLEQSEKK